MEKKLYISPLIEVAKVNMSAVVLTGSPENPSTDTHPLPPIGPAPKRHTEVF